MEIKGIDNVLNKAVSQGSSDLEIKNQLQKSTTTVQKENQQSLKEFSKEELEDLFKKMKDKFDYMNKYLKIEIDKELHQPVVKIIDKKTDKVIRQIPPEHLLELAKKLDELVGLLFNKEA
ncbi:MAG: flagellar protein FlaG [Aquificae bacterium]|nr:flagellar protein FlaG [Aquificota bacterium]